jgi:uncharacterized protein (TIGR02266 family)
MSALGNGGVENDRIAPLVEEFLPLNRRKVQGNPPLSVLELQRWSELSEQLAYELGDPLPAGGGDRSLRVPTHLKVRFGEGTGELRNVSEGGLFIECERPLAHGTPLQLELEPGGDQPSILLSATVVWSRDLAGQDGPPGFGVRFEDLEADEYELLMLLIETELFSALAD